MTLTYVLSLSFLKNIKNCYKERQNVVFVKCLEKILESRTKGPNMCNY
jgi:hypothetical protein